MRTYISRLWLRYWMHDTVVSIRKWWARYSGSIAIVGLLGAIAVALWVDRRKTNQLEQAMQLAYSARAEIIIIQDRMQADREERLHRALVDSLTRVRSNLERDIRRQALADRLVVEAVRRANIEGCKRENRTRYLLRRAAEEQLNVTKNLTRRNTRPDQPLSEWIQDWSAYDAAWTRIVSTLQSTDCAKAYPPPNTPLSIGNGF